MNRINLIKNHPLYKTYYNHIQSLEESRQFCGHDMTHFMDVARIAYILYLEDCISKGNTISFRHCENSKEAIYAAGLLHDIGRHLQYTTGQPHEIASKKLCHDILSDCDFDTKEILAIQEAIGNHRNPLIKDEKTLSGYLYKGDKASRPCFSCPMEEECNWPTTKKNLTLTI